MRHEAPAGVFLFGYVCGLAGSFVHPRSCAVAFVLIAILAIRVRQITPGSKGPLWGQKRIVEMIFPGSQFTAGDTVQLTWYDGGMEPDLSKITLPQGVQLPASGTYWIGESGSIFKKYGNSKPVVLPEAK